MPYRNALCVMIVSPTCSARIFKLGRFMLHLLEIFSTRAGTTEISTGKYHIEVMTDADDPPDIPDNPWLAKAREILLRRGVQDLTVIDAEVRQFAERLGLIGKSKQKLDE
jgi:hypothetical protein